jgi:hypothetical protein
VSPRVQLEEPLPTSVMSKVSYQRPNSEWQSGSSWSSLLPLLPAVLLPSPEGHLGWLCSPPAAAVRTARRKYVLATSRAL